MRVQDGAQHFEEGDVVLYWRAGSVTGVRGQVLEVDRAGSGELDWLLVQEPFEGAPEDADLHQHRLPARQACLLQSPRRAFVVDVLRMIDAAAFSTVLGDAIDRHWVARTTEARGDESDDALVTMLRGERSARSLGTGTARLMSEALQDKLRASWAGMTEVQQVSDWEKTRDWWLGFSKTAPHGGPAWRAAHLLEARPLESGDEAHAALIDGTRPLRVRCRDALHRLSPPDADDL